jgi:hypothetical protein
MTKNLLAAFIFIIFFIGCHERPPVAVDGSAVFELHAYWNPGGSDSLEVYEPLKKAKVLLISEYGILIRETDNSGIFYCDNLPYARYSVSVRMPHPDDPNIVVVGNIKNVDLVSKGSICDTIFAKPFSSFGISINEIYSVGPVNSIFFFYDQYIELYNSSDEIKYLDGMMISRVSGNNDAGGLGPGADQDDDGDIDGFTYVFKFPGSPGEENHPVYPKQFIVLASDAINHRSVVSTAVDLSKADWEFFNQFSADDIDNPNVPNLINMRSDRTVDFLINLVADVIILSDGRDTSWADGIDISSVIDGVEYQSNPNSKKTLDGRVDRGYALSPPRYSGQSMQRREPGSDSNDATLDWDIIPYPTPGYQ